MSPTASSPEQKARAQIDAALVAAGWVVHDRDAMNLSAGRGVAVREFKLTTGHGFADYLLFVDAKAVGVLEAKPEGHTLSGVEVQAEKYSTGLPTGLNPPVEPLPFLYLSTGAITKFTNLLDPDPRSRRILQVHQPGTLAEWLAADTLDTWVKSAGHFTSAEDTRPSSLRARLRAMPPVEATEAEIDELRLHPGDVLFNEGGDRDKLGRGWVWNGELPECIHQNHVFRARILTHDLHPKLLSWYGNTAGQQYFFEQGKQTTNLASINLTKLRGLPVPIPPLAEQGRIVAETERRLSLVDEAEQLANVSARRCVRLRQSILKWAFEGRLADQDPSDEPASALLERIRLQTSASRQSASDTGVRQLGKQ